MKLMTFDVGGTEIKYAVMNEDYFVTHKGSLPTPMDSFDRFASVIRNIYLLHKDEV